MKKDDSRRDSAASEAPAEGASLAAVSSLMDERRRFEGWIASLEARRASTAPHVFERVHADYTTRLGAVLEKLTTHADGLRSELAALSLRLDGLRDEQKRAEDERAEGELRAHVGELSASDWERMAASSDARLGEIAQKSGSVEQELTRTRELLDDAERPAGSVAPEPAADVPAMQDSPAPALASPPPAPEAPATRKSVPVAARQSGALAVESEVERKPAARASAAVAQPAEPVVAEQQSLGIEEKVPPAHLPPEDAAPAAPAPPAPVSASPLVRPGVELTPPSSPRLSKFDELAFLSSVVDAPSGAIEPAPSDLPDEKTRRETFAMRAHDEEIENLSSRRSTPLDNLVTEYEREEKSALSGRNEPSAARASLGADGAKTLKCSECASMNYPTEWYCERCGAELASL